MAHRAGPNGSSRTGFAQSAVPAGITGSGDDAPCTSRQNRLAVLASRLNETKRVDSRPFRPPPRLVQLIPAACGSNDTMVNAGDGAGHRARARAGHPLIAGAGRILLFDMPERHLDRAGCGW